MSGVIENGRACVGLLGLHPYPYYDAYDLIADDGGDSCSAPDETQPELMQVKLRALGYSSVPHVTLAAYMWSDYYETDLCDYVEARTVHQPSGGLRGTYRYIHVQGGSDYWIDVVAGPSLPRTEPPTPIGTTTHDSNCQGGLGWDGHHVHQDARFNQYSTANPNLPIADDIDVWNVFNYIHRWTYPLLDTDGDDFTDAAEVYLGTDPFDDCPDNTSDEAWPPDFNNDRRVNLADIGPLRRAFNSRTGDPNYSRRVDLNTNGSINLGDIIMLRAYFNTICA